MVLTMGASARCVPVFCQALFLTQPRKPLSDYKKRTAPTTESRTEVVFMHRWAHWVLDTDDVLLRLQYAVQISLSVLTCKSAVIGSRRCGAHQGYTRGACHSAPWGGHHFRALTVLLLSNILLLRF